MIIKPITPTYESSVFSIWFEDINGINPKNYLTGIVVQMLESVEINNILFESGKKYKIPYWIAKELNRICYCFYTIKPEDFFE